MISPDSNMSIRSQCDLLGVARSNYYYQPIGESAENLKYMRIIDEQYMRTPYFGYRKMSHWMLRQGYHVNVKRIRRLMHLMGLQGTVPGMSLPITFPLNFVNGCNCKRKVATTLHSNPYCYSVSLLV